MLTRKRTAALAVIPVLGLAALGAWMFLWRTPVGNKPTAEQEEVRQNPEPWPAQPILPPKKDSAPAEQRTRHAFTQAMSELKQGMSKEELLAILGKPDDVRTREDPGGISTTRTKEIWRYGTNGHLTFPTLGCVYIDTHDQAQYFFGGHGEPPDPKTLPEAELRSLLQLIDTAPSYNPGYNYDPLAIVRIVNALQPLGKDKALAVISEYLRVASRFHSQSPACGGIFLILRVLFDVPADPGYMPHMFVGAPSPTPEPEDPKRLPRFPILLQDDIPLMLVSGHSIGGRPEAPEKHVEYFRQNGRVRDKPLMPSNDPLRLMDVWAKRTAGLYPGELAAEGKSLIANQILAILDSVYRRKKEEYGFRFWSWDDVDGHWNVIAAEIAKLDIRWNSEKQRYTFKDGSHLPDPIRKLYRRHIWRPEGVVGETSVVVERTDENHVWISLEWLGEAAQRMPPFTLNAVAVKDKSKSLTSSGGSSFQSRTNSETLLSQSFEMELAEGEEVQAQLIVGKRELLSPVYKP